MPFTKVCNKVCICNKVFIKNDLKLTSRESPQYLNASSPPCLTLPQLRQWCRRRTKVKGVLQAVQRSTSWSGTHSGGSTTSASQRYGRVALIYISVIYVQLYFTTPSIISTTSTTWGSVECLGFTYQSFTYSTTPSIIFRFEFIRQGQVIKHLN